MGSKKKGQPLTPFLMESTAALEPAKFHETLKSKWTKVPELFAVYLLHDDYTPREFVVEVLERFFFMNAEAATQIMLQVHYQGKGVCGLYSRDVAETKVVQVNEYSRRNQHPLLCNMEVT